MRCIRVVVVFTGLLLFCWLMPAPSENFELGCNTAEAGARKTKVKAAAKSAAHHHVHIKKAMKRLHSAKRMLAATPVPYGGHRERALRAIDTALHDLRILERHLKHEAKKKR